MFHDIGKARIPLAVLDKPNRLEPGERALIETHSAAGHDILKSNPRHLPEILHASGTTMNISRQRISRRALRREHFDLVRILTISDIFAALIEFRQYRPAMPAHEPTKYSMGCHASWKLRSSRRSGKCVEPLKASASSGRRFTRSLIGARLHRGRHVEPERLGGFSN